jgi:histidinol-phosphate phosphatase family protein
MNSQNYSIQPDSALFIDRDGVINQLRKADYVKQIEEFILLPEVIPAFKILRKKFKFMFIVTNQQGIGKGLMINSIDEIHNHFLSLLPKNIHPDKIYYCPHLSSDNCACRKPKPGMALLAKHEFPAINLINSFMIGDSDSDMEFGINAGMKVFKIAHNEIASEIPLFSNILDFAVQFDKY